MATLDIVIVNWNTGDQLRSCLESIAGASAAGFTLERIVVIDNGSSDGSASGLQFPFLPLEIFLNGDNLGFAAACNRGAEGSGSDYILFLNPDTVLEADSIRVPVEFLERPESGTVGIAGIKLVDLEGIASRTCARFPGPAGMIARSTGIDRMLGRFGAGYIMYEWDHSDSRRVDHVIGAFYLVRRVLFEEIGGFDERFFVYLEDLDFSLRASEKGWSCYFHSGARAYHRGGGASGSDRSARLFYSLRSRLIYSSIHFGKVGSSLVLMSTVVVEPAIRFLSAIVRLSGSRIRETAAGYLMLWKEIPRIVGRG